MYRYYFSNLLKPGLEVQVYCIIAQINNKLGSCVRTKCLSGVFQVVLNAAGFTVWNLVL